MSRKQIAGETGGDRVQGVSHALGDTEGSRWRAGCQHALYLLLLHLSVRPHAALGLGLRALLLLGLLEDLLQRLRGGGTVRGGERR